MHSTRIDLSAKTRARVIALLNARLADAIDLQRQAKQAHWNVKGPQFIALHELFDRLAGELDACVDDMAERITALGGIHDLAATAVALFQAALGEIRHGPILSSAMTLCQYMERHPSNVLMSSPGDRLDRAPPLFQTGSGAGPVGAGDPPAATG